MQRDHLICLQPYQNKMPIGYVGIGKQKSFRIVADLFIAARLPCTVGNTKLAAVSSLQQQIMSDKVLEVCVFSYSTYHFLMDLLSMWTYIFLTGKWDRSCSEKASGTEGCRSRLLSKGSCYSTQVTLVQLKLNFIASSLFVKWINSWR